MEKHEIVTEKVEEAKRIAEENGFNFFLISGNDDGNIISVNGSIRELSVSIAEVISREKVARESVLHAVAMSIIQSKDVRDSFKEKMEVMKNSMLMMGMGDFFGSNSDVN